MDVKSSIQEFLTILFHPKGLLLNIIINHINSSKKLLYEKLSFKEQIKTSVVLFSDITNSTRIIKEYPREGLFIVRDLVKELSKTIEKYNLLINEIPGDGVLYSLNFEEMTTNYNSYKLEEIVREIHSNYNRKKRELIEMIKDTEEYQSNKNFYTNIIKYIDSAYLKTAICVDGIYFLPIENISFKQSILYGIELWNIPKIFQSYSREKRKSDIILIHENFFYYMDTFNLPSFNIKQGVKDGK